MEATPATIATRSSGPIHLSLPIPTALSRAGRIGFPFRRAKLAAAPSNSREPAAQPATQPDADLLVAAGSARELRYTAKPGDTVSTLAGVLLGSDTKENRDAIINSNPTLKQDPDRVIAGLTYWIPAPTALPGNR